MKHFTRRTLGLAVGGLVAAGIVTLAVYHWLAPIDEGSWYR